MTSLVDHYLLETVHLKTTLCISHLTGKITRVFRKRLSFSLDVNVIILLLVSLPVGISPEPAAHPSRNSFMGQRTGSSLFKDKLETIWYSNVSANESLNFYTDILKRYC